MLEMDVGDEICWRQLLDVADGFDRFRHQYLCSRLDSFYCKRLLQGIDLSSTHDWAYTLGPTALYITNATQSHQLSFIKKSNDIPRI